MAGFSRQDLDRLISPMNRLQRNLDGI